MKKVIIILLVVLGIAGIVYLGYLIFNAKNVEAVELSGEIQTLYVVGDDIDFEDAKLKVTYKNGDIQMVDLDSSSVQIDMFSTSIEKQGTMNIVYKNHVINVDYVVIKNGLYYLSNEKTYTWNYTTGSLGSVPSTTYVSPTASKELIFLGQNGVLQYYTKDSYKWYMNDGKYDSSYNYTIEKDTLIVNAGKDNQIKIKVNYDSSGSLNISSEEQKVHEDTGLVYEINVTSYKWYNMKPNRVIKAGSLEVDLSQTEYTSSTDPNTHDYVTFNRGENIETSGKEIYVKVEFANDTFLNTIYVRVTDSMVQRNSLDTENVYTLIRAVILYYEGEEFTLYYTVSY